MEINPKDRKPFQTEVAICSVPHFSGHTKTLYSFRLVAHCRTCKGELQAKTRNHQCGPARPIALDGTCGSVAVEKLGRGQRCPNLRSLRRGPCFLPRNKFSTQTV